MKTEIKKYIQIWEDRCYYDGIPDEVPKEITHLVPSYKKIAIAILKNDLSELGFVLKHSKFYDALKRIELKEREKNDKV